MSNGVGPVANVLEWLSEERMIMNLEISEKPVRKDSFWMSVLTY